MSLRKKAITLRKQGASVGNIANTLSVSKSSVSLWVKDVILTKKQKIVLKRNIHSPSVIEKRRQSRIANEIIKRSIVIDNASRDVPTISNHDLIKMIGVALYWGEGGKTMKGMARISNSDPGLIKMSMRFFREVCKVKEHRFRAYVHTHSAGQVKEIEKYWSDITNIPRSQFYKTSIMKSRSSKNIRKTLPYGTIDVGVCDTKLLLKILGWIEGIKKQI